MTEISNGTLQLLQGVSTGGLAVCLLLAAVFAVMALGTSGERTRREALLARNGAEVARRDAQAESLTEVVRLRGQVTEARREAEGAEGRVDLLTERIAELEEQLTEAQRVADAAPPMMGPATFLPDVPEEVREAFRPEAARMLAEEQAAAITATLSDHAGDFSIEVTSAPEEEARLYAAQLAQAIRRAGVKVEGPFGVLTTLQGEGVFVSTEGEAGGVVLAALQGASLVAQPVAARSPEAVFLKPDETDVRVYVGGAPKA